MEKTLIAILENYPDVRYRIRYVDYEEGVWTLPIPLTDYRIKQFAKDKSLDKCEVIFQDGELIILSNQ